MSRIALALSLTLLAGAARAETFTVKSGVADDLQAALDALQDGDELVIKGTYFTAELSEGDSFELSGRADITLRGTGKAVIDATDDSTGLVVDDVQGLTLEHLIFQNGSDDGIFMTSSSDFSASKCRFLDCGDSGIEDKATQGFVIVKCRFIRCSWGLAVGYDTEGDTGVVISKSKFIDCAGVGADIWASDALVEKCKFKGTDGAYGAGINPDFTGTTIQKCRFIGLYTGIWVEGSGNFVLSNKVKHSAGNGIEIFQDGGNTVAGNKVIGSEVSGLWVGSTGNTIEDNVLKDNVVADLESTQAEELNTFTDNVFETAIFP